MQIHVRYSIFALALLLTFGFCDSSYAGVEDEARQFELFDKDTVSVLDLARRVEDNFVSIRNYTKKNLYLLAEKWRSDSLSAIGYEGETNLSLPKYSQTIVPPEDSILVEIDISFEDQRADNWKCGGLLTLYYVFEGEDILRSDSLYVMILTSESQSDTFSKYSSHASINGESKSCGLLLGLYNQAGIGIISKFPEKTLFIDTLITKASPFNRFTIERLLRHNREHKNDTNGRKMFHKSELFYNFYIDQRSARNDVITTEIRLRDSATNVIYSLKDTLYVNIYRIGKLRSHQSSWSNKISKNNKSANVISINGFVCADQEIVIEQIQLIENNEKNFFSLERIVDLPFKLTSTPAIKIIPEYILAEVKFASDQNNEIKTALVKTTYRGLADGKIGYHYFPIIVKPD